MTEIGFYSGVANPLVATARLIGKAHRQGRRVRVVTADAAATAALDALLWTEPPESFLPHVTLDSPHAAQTPVIIDHRREHRGAIDVLINLGVEPPPFFARFERLFEIVGRDAALVDAGRARWKFYSERGYPLTHTVMQAS